MERVRGEERKTGAAYFTTFPVGPVDPTPHSPRRGSNYNPLADYINIKGARSNNLKNISLCLPRNQMIAVTGLSGSGKSSLVFGTLFSEGQRRYVESLSSYARQFLERLDKPDVDEISGLSPVISVSQNMHSRNPRSTVGTMSEVYDYLRIFMARIGTTYSPISGEEVKKDSPSSVVDLLRSQNPNCRILISASILNHDSKTPVADQLTSKGFTRVVDENDEIFEVEDVREGLQKTQNSLRLLIDRCRVKEDEETERRMTDSLAVAFQEGAGTCFVKVEGGNTQTFSCVFERDGMIFPEPDPALFIFTNSLGACQQCQGLGNVHGIDNRLVIPDPSLSLKKNAIQPWAELEWLSWRDQVLKHPDRVPSDVPIRDLTEQQRRVLWDGCESFEGINRFLENLEKTRHLITSRVTLSRISGRIPCPGCRGTRVRADAGYIRFEGLNIVDMVLMQIRDLRDFFLKVKLAPHLETACRHLLAELRNRLSYLEKVGLGYLDLNREARTLSGGEFQRIRLATILGSCLQGAIYTLDEPSIGLHSRDTSRLIGILKNLRDLGNTVVVVEHDEEIIKACDHIIDMGPEAGFKGGELMYEGPWPLSKEVQNPSLTLEYLLDRKKVGTRTFRPDAKESIMVRSGQENNLKDVEVEIPLGRMTVVTGVSGSGKSTLVHEVIGEKIRRYLSGSHLWGEAREDLRGPLHRIVSYESMSQDSLGKSSRSNCATYTGAFQGIRDLFARQSLARELELSSSKFSFNSEGGRCEVCKGEGSIHVEMQYMADLKLRCEECQGMRYKPEVLSVKYKDKNINEILNLTVSQALELFSDQKAIARQLLTLQHVGLDYLTLGQPTSSLSGGEVQRLKISMFLDVSKYTLEGDETIMLVFDEPTIGLHPHDVHALLDSFSMLAENGYTLIVIEHNLDVMRNGDWIIDMGPEGGNGGGEVCFMGTIKDFLHESGKNITASYL